MWKFFLPPGPTFPVGASPTSRTYTSVTGNLTGEDYVGLLMGDVSGNWNNTGARGPQSGGSEREIIVNFPDKLTASGKEIVVPVNVDGIANKGVISYEVDLRYDPLSIEPAADPVDIAGTVSRGLIAVTNTSEPGLLRVVLYGPMPIEENGVLLNLKFTAIGAMGSVSPLSFERIMFNEGEPRVTAVDGQVELSPTVMDQK